MELSGRLLTISTFITKGNTVADIGTDHGYLPVYLILKGISRRVLAMDIGKGPLKSAEKSIALYGVADKVEVRQSDGLCRLAPGEAETIVIAGMGGGLICKILERELTKAKSARELVLSPQSEIGKVRRFLRENGFVIEKEDMLVDEGKYYVVMRAVKGFPPEDSDTGDSYIEDKYGRYLLKSQNPVLMSALEKEKKSLSGIFKGLLEVDTPKARARREEIKEELEAVDKALQYWEVKE